MIANGVHALLVSNRQHNTEFIQKLLADCQQGNIFLEYAVTVAQAQRSLLKRHFDILLISTEDDIDQRLSLIRWTREREHARPPVITISDDDSPSLYQLALQAGAADSLSFDQLSSPLLERCIRTTIRQKADEARLLQFAHYDPLTGVANRQLFNSKLKDALAQAKRSEQLLALMILDLDNFKQINDSLGHIAGNEVLSQLADRLRNSIRETDTVARLGGDEFSIIATQLKDADDAATMARGILQSCCFPISSDQSDLLVSCSIGIALYPQDGSETNLLLRQADAALLKSKLKGRCRFQYADKHINKENQSRKKLVKDLSTAISRDEFQLLFQPVVASDEGMICGAEALLRWNHPQKGLLSPGQFIHAAEKNGLISSLGNWVLRQCCQQHMNWLSQGLPPIPLSINLSPLQLLDSNLLETVQQLIHRHNFDPQQLNLEVNAKAFYEFSNAATEQLCELHDLGVGITVDNFGRNYYSLEKLGLVHRVGHLPC